MGYCTDDADIETAIAGFVLAIGVGILCDDAATKVESGLETSGVGLRRHALCLRLRSITYGRREGISLSL